MHIPAIMHFSVHRPTIFETGPGQRDGRASVEGDGMENILDSYSTSSGRIGALDSNRVMGAQRAEDAGGGSWENKCSEREKSTANKDGGTKEDYSEWRAHPRLTPRKDLALQVRSSCADPVRRDPLRQRLQDLLTPENNGT